MKNWCAQLLLAIVVALVIFDVSTALDITDGFGDGDRNNDGSITKYDSDTILKAQDAGDTGIIWQAMFGHTSSGDRKTYITVIDDSTGDVDSPGLQTGYALGSEGKGSNTSFAGILSESVELGKNVGDRVDVSFDFRGWSQSNNPCAIPVIGQMRFGIYQDSDHQFGQSADKGFEGASVVWGADTGENDGDWKDSNPGPIGDKGYYVNVPIGLAADPLKSSIRYEKNKGRFLQGKSVDPVTGKGGDNCSVANPNEIGQGPGGAIFKLFQPHTIKLSILRTSNGSHLLAYFDGSLVLSNEIDPSNAGVQALGAPPETFDYIAFRHTEEWDMIIDNVHIKAVPVAATKKVLYSDDFEDADRDNDGYSVKDVDVATNGSIDTWKSGNGAFPDPIVDVADPGLPTSGMPWFSAGGFAGTDPKSNPTILNDSPDGLPDSVHINTGLALGLEGKGRGTSTNGFFDPTPTPGVANDQRLELGLNVGDRVTVSFDWRVWESIYAVNKPLLPNRAHLRFGLYQDTDHQLGMNSDFAGPNNVPAVWGNEDGLFRGELARIAPGSNGDHGIYAQLNIGDQILTDADDDQKPDFTGDSNGIYEEINPGVSNAAYYMQGDDADLVAVADAGDPADPNSFFPLLQVGKIYNIEFTIERSVRAAFHGDPKGLFTATVTVNELDENHIVVSTHRFGGEESLGDSVNPDPKTDGVQSDVWDYIGFRNSSKDPEQDYDMVIDNVTIQSIPAP